MILVGMALCSPKASLCCLIGSITGLLVGLFLGVDGYTLYQGLYGYNPALTATAIGGGIFAPASLRAFVWGIFGAAMTAFMHGAIATFLAPAGLPAYTLPFCLVAVVYVGVGVHK